MIFHQYKPTTLISQQCRNWPREFMITFRTLQLSSLKLRYPPYNLKQWNVMEFYITFAIPATRFNRNPNLTND